MSYGEAVFYLRLSTEPDPVVYNTVKFYINDMPYQVKEVPQNKEWSTHFFAQDKFTIRIEPYGYAKPVPSVSQIFTFEELVREHPDCPTIKQTIAPIEVEIHGRDNIVFKVGEDEFACPL